MIDLANLEVWLVLGSQHLYGPDALEKCRGTLHRHRGRPLRIDAYSGEDHVQAGDDQQSTPIHQFCLDANGAENCVGLITWMHTFSPARMWIAGLTVLNKPFLHLHTQLNKDYPGQALTWTS